MEDLTELEQINKQIKELEDKKNALEEENKKKLKEQERERYQEVINAYNKYVELRKAYYEDYKSFSEIEFEYPNLLKLFFGC